MVIHTNSALTTAVLTTGSVQRKKNYVRFSEKAVGGSCCLERHSLEQLSSRPRVRWSRYPRACSCKSPPSNILNQRNMFGCEGPAKCPCKRVVWLMPQQTFVER